MYENKIVKYKFKIENTSPLLIGTGEEGIASLQIDRKKAKIPASTIAGMFRDHLFTAPEQEELYKAIYLEKRNDNKRARKIDHLDKRRQSMMVVEDSFSDVEIEVEKHIRKRMNIKIDSKTGTAEDKKLFETYFIKPGQKFDIELEFRKLAKDNRDSSHSEERKNQMDEVLLESAQKQFDQFIEKLNNGDLTIGANGNKGFGRFKVLQSSITKYDLAKDALKYINDDIEPMTEYKSPSESSYRLDGYVVKLRCLEGMLIKDGVIKEENQTIIDSFGDKINVNSNQKIYKIPASTLKGLSRGFCESIGIEEKIRTMLFGDESTKGKLKFDDIEIVNHREFLKHRICIDRFTGGAKNGAMMNENLICWEKPVEWKLDFSKIDEDEYGNRNYKEDCKIAMLKMIRALALGQIRIGSGSSVGYGKLEVVSIEKLDEKGNE